MVIRPDIAEFVVRVEVWSKRKLNYPLEVSEILQQAVQTGMTHEFEELIFQAKFLIRTQKVMNQIGRQEEGAEKLSVEFSSGITKSMNLLKALTGRASLDDAQKYSTLFFSMETESIARLMKLYSDLSWIKNWTIDGNPLPYGVSPQPIAPALGRMNPISRENHLHELSPIPLDRIRRSALLAAILMVFFLLIDPPVTILGWVLSLGITALLAYIILLIFTFTQDKNHIE